MRRAKIGERSAENGQRRIYIRSVRNQKLARTASPIGGLETQIGVHLIRLVERTEANLYSPVRNQKSGVPLLQREASKNANLISTRIRLV